MVLVLALGAASFGGMAWEDYNFLSTCRTALGRVASVEKKPSGSWFSGDYFLATLSYEVGGDVYRSQLKLDSPSAIGPATVYYDPADPLKSRLDLPRPYTDILITFACAAGIIIIGRRKIFPKKGRPKTPSITVRPVSGPPDRG